MASRAIWKGQIRLSLVSINVEIYSAKKSGSHISFRQIHEPTGKPIRYEKVVAGIGPVEASDIVKGYEYKKDHYLLLEPHEVDAVKLESKKTFELVQFVDACEIPPLFFDKPFYITPTEELAEDAYRVLRDALRVANKVGVGQITMRGREYLAAIKPCGDGLLMETLHYADEIRRADPLFSEVKEEPVSDELLEVAAALIEKKTAPFDATNFKDNYSEAMLELINNKMGSKTSKHVDTEGVDKTSSRENVIDLMSALKKSLGGSEAKKITSKAKSKAPSRGKKTDAQSKKAKPKTTRSKSASGRSSTRAKRKKVS